MSYASHSEGWKRLSHRTYNILLYLLNSNAIAVPHIKQPKDDMFPNTYLHSSPSIYITNRKTQQKIQQPKPLNFKPSAYTINQAIIQPMNRHDPRSKPPCEFYSPRFFSTDSVDGGSRAWSTRNCFW